MKLIHIQGTCKVPIIQRGKTVGWTTKGFATTVQKENYLEKLEFKLESTTFKRPVKDIEILNIIEHQKGY